MEAGTSGGGLQNQPSNCPALLESGSYRYTKHSYINMIDFHSDLHTTRYTPSNRRLSPLSAAFRSAGGAQESCGQGSSCATPVSSPWEDQRSARRQADE